MINGRIVNNNTTPNPFSEQRLYLFEESYGYQKWYNLTITNAKNDNLGKYMCVAENTAGVRKKYVTLTFDDPPDNPYSVNLHKPIFTQCEFYEPEVYEEEPQGKNIINMTSYTIEKWHIFKGERYNSLCKKTLTR